MQPEVQEELSIGVILKTKRQKLKMELSDVSLYLKVKLRDLEAIENDNFDSITRHLYIIGLIRSYAKFLKIMPNIIEAKIKLLPTKSNVDNKKYQLLNIGENTELTPSKNSFFNFLLISILSFLILLSLYNLSENKSDVISGKKLLQELEKLDFQN